MDQDNQFNAVPEEGVPARHWMPDGEVSALLLGQPALRRVGRLRGGDHYQPRHYQAAPGTKLHPGNHQPAGTDHPIVDIRLLLGQPSQSDNCIIILNIEDTLVGILVDTVQKMIDVDISADSASPSQDTRNLVSGMCSLSEEQTMLVFDCPQILNQP